MRLRDFLSIRTGWADMALLVPFEQARVKPALWAGRIGQYVGLQPREPLAEFCARTMINRTGVREGQHIRTGGRGAAHELPDHWRRVIEEIEAEALDCKREQPG